MVANVRERIAAAKSAISRKAYDEAFTILRGTVLPEDDYISQARVAKTYSSFKSALPKLKSIKLALLASTTVDHFAEILRFWLALEGFSADIWIAPYDTTIPTILDPGSELYSFRPDIVWMFSTHRDAHLDIANGDSNSVSHVIATATAKYKTLWETIHQQLSCVVLQNNADIPAGDTFGNYAGQALWARRNVLRRYNLELAAATSPGVIIFDLDQVASNFGRTRWIDWRYWYHSKHAFAFDACGSVAFQASRLISGLKGLAKKCLVLDLDNTLWGGVIGDDGLSGIKLGNGPDGEAFVDFQKYVLRLKHRGIVLAVCSKNEEDTAKEPFIKHPDMQIRLEDIAVFRANWTNKADNIRDIARILNIGLDSLVFVDDNPVERNLIREFLPMVAVPELSDDPSEYASAIEKHSFFETIGFSREDRERASYYRHNAQRTELMAQFTNISSYLQSLQMTSKKGALNTFHLPRMAQLINKSNQFHLTGTRYSEAELQSHARTPNMAVRYFKLADKFGDNGLIAVVVLIGEPGHNLVIDTWVMSCRVLGRTMEEFILNDIIEVGCQMDCRAIIGRYFRSEKNKLVASLYPRLGFTAVSEVEGASTWRLELTAEPKTLETWVIPSKERATMDAIHE